MKQVIQTSEVMPYEQFGFTNCVRFQDVLYLSGISALDLQGRVIGDDIETQTLHTFRNIERVLRAGGSDLDQILQMTVLSWIWKKMERATSRLARRS